MQASSYALLAVVLLSAGCAREAVIPTFGLDHPANPQAPEASIDYSSALSSGPVAPVPGPLNLGGHGTGHGDTMSHGADRGTWQGQHKNAEAEPMQHGDMQREQ